MKTRFIILLLLSLVIGKEFPENDDDVILRATAVGGLQFKGSITTDIKTIYSTIMTYTGILLTLAPDQDYKTSENKGRFASKIENGYVISMYFHATKKHYAICDGGFMGGGYYKKEAKPGEWAVAYCKAGLGWRKSGYDEDN